MGNTYTYTFDIQGNIEPIKNALSQLEGTMSNMKLSPNITSGVTDAINKAKRDLESLEIAASKSYSSMKEAKEITKLYKDLDDDLLRVQKSISNIKGLDPNKIVPMSLVQSFRSITDAVKKYNDGLKDKTANKNLSDAKKNVDNLSKSLSKAQTAYEKLSNESKSLPKQIKEAKKNLDSATASAKKLETAYNQSKNNKNASAVDTKTLKQQYDDAINTVKKLQSDLDKLTERKKQVDIDIKPAKAELESLKKQVASAQDKFDKLDEATKSVNANNLEEVRKKVAALANVDISEVPQDLAELQNYITQLKADKIKDISDKLQEMSGVVDGLTPHMKELDEEMGKGEQQLTAWDKKVAEVNSMQSRIEYLFSMTNAFMLLRNAITNVYDNMKELDKTMTETAVVSDFTVSDMWEKLPQYSQEASELGASINDLYEATTLYYQQGLKEAQANELATSTLKMARIAGLDASEATDRMTNALRGFNMELNNTSAENVADVYSKLAAISASNVDEISTAMTKVASLADSANMSFENTAAFLAQIIETTRESAETAGTALKTVVARFAEIKENPNDIVDVDGEEVSYNKVDKALQTVGISLDKFINGEEGLDEVLMRLSEKWDSLSVAQQRYIATMAAGSRQQSRFIALMQDYDRMVELTTEANNASGASEEQYEKTLDSLEAKLNQLQNAWQTFWMTLINSEGVKTIIDVLTNVLNALNDLNSGLDPIAQKIAVIAEAFLGWKIASSVIQTGIKSFAKILTSTSKTASNVVKTTETGVTGFSAVLTGVSDVVGKVGEGAISASEKFAEFGVNLTKTGESGISLFTTLADKFSSFLTVFTEGFTKFFTNIGTGLKGIGTAITSFAIANPILTTVLGLLTLISIVVIALIAHAEKLNKITSTTKLNDRLANDLTDLAEATDDANSKVTELSNSYDELANKREELSELTKGTQAWSDKMIEVNEQTQELADELGVVAKMNADGVLVISQEDYESGIQKAQNRANQLENLEAGLTTVHTDTDIASSFLTATNLAIGRTSTQADASTSFSKLSASEQVEMWQALAKSTNAEGGQWRIGDEITDEQRAILKNFDVNAGAFSIEMFRLSDNAANLNNTLSDLSNSMSSSERAWSDQLETTMQNSSNTNTQAYSDYSELFALATEDIQDALESEMQNQQNVYVQMDSEQLYNAFKNLDTEGLFYYDEENKKVYSDSDHTHELSDDDLRYQLIYNDFSDIINSAADEFADSLSSLTKAQQEYALALSNGTLTSAQYDSFSDETISAFKNGNTDAAVQAYISKMGYGSSKDMAEALGIDEDTLKSQIVNAFTAAISKVNKNKKNMLSIRIRDGGNHDSIESAYKQLQTLNAAETEWLNSVITNIDSINSEMTDVVFSEDVWSQLFGEEASESAQELIESMDFSDPVESALALQDALQSDDKELQDLASRLKTAGGDFFSYGNQITSTLTSVIEENEDEIDSYIEASGEVTAANMQELIKSSESLQKVIKSTGVSASGLAKALNYVAVNGGSLEDLDSYALFALDSMSSLADETDELAEKLAEFSPANSSMANLETMAEWAEELYKNITEYNDYADPETLSYLREFLGQDWLDLNYGSQVYGYDFSDQSQVDAIEAQVKANIDQVTKDIYDYTQDHGLSFWEALTTTGNDTWLTATDDLTEMLGIQRKAYADYTVDVGDHTRKEIIQEMEDTTGYTEEFCNAMLQSLESLSPAMSAQLDLNGFNQGLETMITGVDELGEKVDSMPKVGDKIYVDEGTLEYICNEFNIPLEYAEKQLNAFAAEYSEQVVTVEYDTIFKDSDGNAVDADTAYQNLLDELEFGDQSKEDFIQKTLGVTINADGTVDLDAVTSALEAYGFTGDNLTNAMNSIFTGDDITLDSGKTVKLQLSTTIETVVQNEDGSYSEKTSDEPIVADSYSAITQEINAAYEAADESLIASNFDDISFDTIQTNVAEAEEEGIKEGLGQLPNTIASLDWSGLKDKVSESISKGVKAGVKSNAISEDIESIETAPVENWAANNTTKGAEKGFKNVKRSDAIEDLTITPWVTDVKDSTVEGAEKGFDEVPSLALDSGTDSATQFKNGWDANQPNLKATVTVTTIENKVTTSSSSSKKKNSSHASGGFVSSGIDSLVGEEGPEIVWNKEQGYSYLAGPHGPEIVHLIPGDQVYTAQETRKILSRAAGGSILDGSRILSNATASFGKTDVENSQNRYSDTDKTLSSIDNNLSKMYNLIQSIEKLEHEQTIYEKKYEQMLTRGNTDLGLGVSTSSIWDITSNRIGAAQNYQEQYVANKQKMVNDEYLLNTDYGASGYYSRYFQYANGQMNIDWNAINALAQSTSEDDHDLYNDITNNLSKAEEYLSDMNSAEENLYDIQDSLEEINEQGLSDYVSLESEVASALKSIDQDRVDQLSDIYSAINDANSNIVSRLQTVIDEERNIRDLQDNKEDLDNQRQRLLFLQQDTSGANQLSIKSLQSNIKDAEQSYTDQLVDNAITELQNGNTLAQEQRQTQIELMQAQIDWNEQSGAYNLAAQRAIVASFDSNGNFAGLNSAVGQIMSKANNWSADTKIALSQHLSDLNEKMTAGGSWLAAHSDMLDNKDYATGVDLQPLADALNLPIATFSSDVATNFQKLAGDLSTTFQNNIKTPEVTVNVTVEGGGTTKTTTSSSSGTGGSTSTSTYTSTPGSSGSGSGGSSASIDYSRTVYVVKGTSYEGKTVDWYGDNLGTANYLRSQIMSNGTVQFYYAGSSTPYLRYRKNTIYDNWEMYKSGGLADYTGPAWLDGTPSKPEIVLNAEDSANFVQLRDILRGWSNNGTSQNTGANYYDIDINVDELGSDYDVDQLSDAIEQRILSASKYRNVQTVSLTK